ncbi:Uncharacterised protein [Serratia ficaria]|nr:Uncharacterised protein [Serratia ficaria]CAI0865497.1 Uncharacterised protein [Serratia ficaria]CAI1536898.1 Uncharacterised protein [Serratia ficaria]CAI1580000.1 Uncharacterised protein [Serratia ficaria]CAI1883772.1 Uncharacterised protein [Serratia ficaria]
MGPACAGPWGGGYWLTGITAPWYFWRIKSWIGLECSAFTNATISGLFTSARCTVMMLALSGRSFRLLYFFE